MTDKLVREIAKLAEIMRLAAQYRPGQTFELEGWKLRVIDIDGPNEYRRYAMVDVEPLGKRIVPARAVATLDENGLHFRVPEGWRNEF